MISRKIKIYKNGATLVYKKHHGLKKTSVVAGFVFGENRDNYPEPTAHFCEHMFFNETNSLSNQQLKTAMKNTFSMKNGRTDKYYTEIDFCRANKALEPSFKLASDMLLNTKFSNKHINSEKGVIKQELVQRLSNHDALSKILVNKTLCEKYYSNTMVLGSKEEIDAITPKTLKKFRDDCFISENFVISVEGGISYTKAKRLAEKYFINKLKSNPNFPVDKNIISKTTRTGNMLVDYFSAPNSTCTIIIKLDKSLETEKTMAISNMMGYICNSIAGKLSGRLRDKGLVYTAIYQYSLVPNDYLSLIKFNCSSENINKCIVEIGKLIHELKTTKIENDILNDYKRNNKLSKDERTISIYPSRLFIQYLTFGEESLSKKRNKRIEKIFDSLTPEDIQQFCQEAFSVPENIYVAILSDKKPETFYTYKQIQDIITQNKKPKKDI